MKITDEILTCIDPNTAPKFSRNLHQWLRRWKDVSVDIEAFASERGRIYIGFRDDAFLCGSELNNVLCNGGKADRGAYPILNRSTPLPDFWDDYMQRGRCAIDPAHEVPFRDSAERFTLDGDTRTCRWCGSQHQRVVTPRTVYDTTWMPLPNPPMIAKPIHTRREHDPDCEIKYGFGFDCDCGTDAANRKAEGTKVTP